MYKLYKDQTNIKNVGVILDDKMSIPFATDNTDYANFKKAINEETAELQDADGNTMTAAEAKAFIATLP